jgi:hypothetical protein
MKPVAENESRHLGQNEMAGLKGKSGPGTFREAPAVDLPNQLGCGCVLSRRGGETAESTTYTILDGRAAAIIDNALISAVNFALIIAGYPIYEICSLNS